MPSTIYSVKSIGFTQPALLFSNLVCMPILCVSLQTMLQKKKKRLKKGNKKKDNHKTKYYKTNKLSVLKSKITELQLSLYVKPSEAQRTEKIINYYSLGEWQKGFRVYWARTSQFLKFHAVQRFPDMILASEEIEFQKWRKREVTLRRGGSLENDEGYFTSSCVPSAPYAVPHTVFPGEFTKGFLVFQLLKREPCFKSQTIKKRIANSKQGIPWRGTNWQWYALTSSLLFKGIITLWKNKVIS